MPELPITVQGELRPEWLIKLEEALVEMNEAGWYFSGHDEDFQELEFQSKRTYEWRGKINRSRWTIDLPTYSE